MKCRVSSIVFARGLQVGGGTRSSVGSVPIKQRVTHHAHVIGRAPWHSSIRHNRGIWRGITSS